MHDPIRLPTNERDHEEARRLAATRHELSRLQVKAKRLRSRMGGGNAWAARRELQRLYDRIARLQSHLSQQKRGDWWSYRKAA